MAELLGTIIIGCACIAFIGTIIKEVYNTYLDILEEEDEARN